MGYRRALAADSRFGLFWAGFSLTVIGDAITKTTMIWFVLETTESTVSVGWLSFWFTAPTIIGGLMAGWLLDKYDRRTVIALDGVLKALLVVSLPILHQTGHLELWYLYAVAGIFGFLLMIPLAGVPSMLPRLVTSKDLNAANSLEAIGFTMGAVVGPPVAGVLLLVAGPLDALYFDAMTYVFFAWATFRTRMCGATPGTEDMVQGTLTGAFKVIFGNAVLASTTMMYLAFNIGLGALFVILPVAAETVLSGGPELYGLLLGCLAVGELVGAILTGSIRLPVTEGLAIGITAVFSGFGIALAAVSISTVGIGTGLFLLGFFSAPLTIWGQTLRMKIIPLEYHGRCFAIMRTLMQAGNPVGGLTAGFGMTLVGVRMAISCVACLIVMVGFAGLSNKKLRAAK